MPALIPELAVTDIAASTAFYRALGFETVYERPEEGFVRLRRGGAQVMLDQLGVGRDPAALTPGDRPFGRGVNLQIEVDRLAPLLAALRALNHVPRLGPENRWYRAGTVEIGQHQLWIEDPDGYLLRFSESLGTRPAEAVPQPEPGP